MKIKVCGLKFAENSSQIAALQVDFVGFIFYKGSPRYVGTVPDPNLLRNIPSTVKKVGVFVNEPADAVLRLVDRYGLDIVQLHGSESVELCAELKKRVQVIKSFAMNRGFVFAELFNYAKHIDYFLFDTPSAHYGGTGETFDHALLEKYDLGLPYFLSGGLDAGRIERLRRLSIQKPFALDINSKFELEPGLKDVAKVNEFINKTKELCLNS